MGRIPRQRLGQGVYHVYNRANDRKMVFEVDEDKEKFLSLLGRFSEPYAINTYHWVIMSNHFHLAVEVLEISELSGWMSKACARYSAYYHDKHGGRGRLWEDRFRTILVQKEGYLNRLGRYIELNPTRTAIEGLQDPWDYRWSSAAGYALNTKDPIINKKDSPVWVAMGADDGERQARYRDYLSRSSDEAAEADIFRSSRQAIGDKLFLSNLSEESGRFSARRVGRPRKVAE